ncbi:glyceraldehyde-3-phosphate dehydrogenase [Bacillus swezeyi]|uniref:Glyceraldehyde-3-phosphate dehydrogenase n=1 Tax=Bacillus swezeyi TaxID=1925020 RepID=A0A1R1QJJ2_9BACI|nr:glyceraldehyde-3-phosphate dehydrogenase [Bacillus swezeyi]MEC1262824.1 glyceraldehyde-3-phosphate dehydrogenase [Bacillus swezeyi]MED1740340.1 glyceraldehyde-3-phosphate dehydrogenase [Bacillus swezeyi]MED2928317.1 glyceraldehyde-3-phosphate dehydrogenase [Bacillus swezeyi]MED2944683.1 glyceraldehyde-3-phosphate dehydrogenase [Bacillus swezeyi]MED2966432.1 glyceraldehyde-3-phosphate dehydrogenase [Bacillus swezeyi]
MKVKVAINGFGRIGRMVFRKAMLDEQIDIAVINASYPAETLAHLIKYDTNHGRYQLDVKAEEDHLLVNGQKVMLTNQRDPRLLPWADNEIDIVVEATGKFNSKEKAEAHIEAGAKKVILTAPGKNEDITIVMGVNEREFDAERHTIISNASCTTNCLAPVAKVLDDAFGIENGLVTTVHAFTNDQKNIDNPHKDLRRARACGSSIIPTTTGAAKALSLVMPHLKGRMHGLALRVPVSNVSLVDLVADLKSDVSAEEINEAFRMAAAGSMSGIIDVCDEPLVSSDFNTNPYSAVIDSLSTMVLENRKMKVLAWYDNEWGYSCRVVDLIRYVASRMKHPSAV